MSPALPPTPDFRALFEAVPGLYVVVLPDAPRYTIVAVSDAYVHATQTTRGALLGSGLLEVFPDNPKDPAATGARVLSASLERVLRHRTVDALAMLKHDIRRGGEAGGGFEERWWSTVNSPVFGASGGLAYVILAVHDITELVAGAPDGLGHQEVAAAVQLQSERTESEALRRGQEVLEVNQQLRRANEEITRLYERTRELDALKSQFFANVSHDLRTPLTLILGPTQRIIDSPETADPVRRVLTVVVRNARLLHRYVDDLLDIAKLDAGRMTLEYARADLARLTRFVAGHFEVLATERGIAYAIEAPESLPAEVDTELLQRVLTNLLSNAFKFAPDGGRVRITLAPGGEARAKIEVADSGPGIPAEQRAKAFERFQQLKAVAATPRTGGTGLGLAIARELVVLHQGTIAIGEAPEGGALFTVELPRTAPAGTAVRAAGAASQAERPREDALVAIEELRGYPTAPAPTAPAPVSADHSLVLVVDDNPDMNRFVADTLRSEHQVATAHDGKEGFAMALALKPDLVVADIMMPEMRGDGLVHAIRSHEALAATPIVLLTAKADDDLRVKMLREGAQDYLTKPFAVEELRARVANLVAKKRAEEALRLAEAKSSGIVAISADAIISVDEAQRITMFNEGAEKIFGYAKSEALGAPLGSLLPERFRALHEQHFERFAAGPESAGHMGKRGAPIFGRRKNGEEFPVDAAISKLEVAGKKVFTVALRDVTEQVRSETEQRFLAEVGSVLASTLAFEDTLTSVAELAVRELADVCIVDIVEEDATVCRLKVISRDPGRAAACDFLRKIPLDQRHPQFVEPVLHTREPVLTPGTPDASQPVSEEQARALRDLGFQAALSVPLLAHGKMQGVMTLVSCTPSRVYGPADLRLAEALAQRAALSLENARLYRAAQRAIEARDDVLGIVAHDLRNPLGNIIMSSLLLRRGAEPTGPARRLMEMIEGAATRMNRIIQDLLDVTRMEAGHLSIEPSRIPAAQIVATAVEAERPLATSGGLELRLEVAPDLPEVWADRDRLLQVFDNLIGNAIKFTERGGQITVGGSAQEGKVLFWVADTGVGIPADDLRHVFDRFWQARKVDRVGAGLGLPIVKGIVEAHGGRIWVESAPGRGSRFAFTIPTAPPAAAPKSGP